MLKLAVIVDRGTVQRFALDALDAITGTDEIAVYSCTNTRTRNRWFRHAAYYALNLLSVRNRLTRYVAVAGGKKKVTKVKGFASEYDAAWQVLPPEIVRELNGFDVVLKFGMGLLRVPPPDVLSTPILSYHHGDPDHYRGRPAGFWEMVDGSRTVGQVVQLIGNKLDAGKVVAFAETRTFPWSYRKTLIEAYRHSPLLVDRAIQNAISGTYLTKESKGRNCRLPTNLAVVVFVGRMLMQLVRRLGYGAFQEKAWRVSVARRSLDRSYEFPTPKDWNTLAAEEGYSFYADPFFSDDGILVEALNKKTRCGEIRRIDDGGDRPLIAGRGHISYPATATIAGKQIIVPETASWSRPRVYSLGKAGAEQTGHLNLDCGSRVLDPTLFEWDGRIFLFGNDRQTGSNILHLWSSDTLDGEFRRHPASPIRISPVGSRMGGNIIERDGRLYRLGQDLAGDYGDGLILFEINDLSGDTYTETLVRRIRFTDRKGPHTLNFRGDEMVFDWYRDRLAPLAGFRRLISTLQRRRRPQATQ